MWFFFFFFRCEVLAPLWHRSCLSWSRALSKWLTACMNTHTHTATHCLVVIEAELHFQSDASRTFFLLTWSSPYIAPSLSSARITARLSQLVHTHTNKHIHQSLAATFASYLLHANVMCKHLSFPAVPPPLQSVFLLQTIFLGVLSPCFTHKHSHSRHWLVVNTMNLPQSFK